MPKRWIEAVSAIPGTGLVTPFVRTVTIGELKLDDCAPVVVDPKFLIGGNLQEFLIPRTAPFPTTALMGFFRVNFNGRFIEYSGRGPMCLPPTRHVRIDAVVLQNDDIQARCVMSAVAAYTPTPVISEATVSLASGGTHNFYVPAGTRRARVRAEAIASSEIPSAATAPVVSAFWTAAVTVPLGAGAIYDVPAGFAFPDEGWLNVPDNAWQSAGAPIARLTASQTRSDAAADTLIAEFECVA